MANYNEHKCFTCGKIYEYCRHCAVIPIVYKAEGFCSEECSHIFNTLSKHGCNLITADEALTELSKSSLDKITPTESILSHVEKIKAESGAKVKETLIIEKPIEAEETAPTEKSIFKFNKK